MGGAMGGGGSGGGSTANVYTPSQQPAADQSLQQLMLPLLGMAANGGAGTPAAANYPAAQGATYNDILNQGYQNQAIGGAQTAAADATGMTVPQAFDSSQWLNQTGAIGLNNAQAPLTQGFNPGYGQAVSGIQNNPYYGQALSGAQNAADMGAQGANAIQGLAGQIGGQVSQQQALAGQVAGYMPQVSSLAGQVGSQVPELQGLARQMGSAVNPLMQSGFDPQSALFNQSQGRLMDQTNAINAMSGLGGTPYGASVGANAMGNFDVNWQNSQQQREIAGANAAGQAAGQAGNLYGQAGNSANTAGNLYGQAGNLGQTASNIYGQAGNSAQTASGLYGAAPGLMSSTSALPSNVYTGKIGQELGALNQQGAAMNQGINGFSALLGSGQSAMTGANSLNTSALQQQQAGTSAPYTTASGIGANSLSGLNNLTAIGNNAYQLPQQEIGNLMQYMQLGQNASSTSGQLGNLAFNQAAQGLGGGLSAASSLFGGGGSGGSSGGLLGSAGSGLSSLFGGAGSAAADFGGGGAAMGVADATGLGLGATDLAAAAPAAMSV
jgi:hypothetical protein